MKVNALNKILTVVLVLALCVTAVLVTYGYVGSDSDNGGGATVNRYVTENDIIIDGSGADACAYAASAGLRSAVSVYCTFEKIVGGNSPWNPQKYTQAYYTTGSGVIYRLEEDGSAFIVTNYHVVYDADSNTDNGVSDKIYVYLYGLESEEYAVSASFVGGSANYDIAVLRVDESDVLREAFERGSVSAAKIGDSDAILPGESTLAIGNPSSTRLSGISVTRGIVSVDSEYITMSASDNSGDVTFRVIRTDTPVNAGNSGGGLYNANGELIGIVNAKISSTDIESIGYAIPSSVATKIADNIIDYCYGKDCETVMRGILGVTVQTSALSTQYDTESGALVKIEEVSVYEVSRGGLAESILKPGDVIKTIKVGDTTKTVTRRHHLIDAMLDVREGDAVKITLVRNGEEITVSTVISADCISAY